MPSEINSRRSWICFVFGPSRAPLGMAVAVALVVTFGPCACAGYPPPPLALASTRDSLAGLDEFGALLLGAGLPMQSIPEGRDLSPEQAERLLRYFSILPSLPQHYAPRFVADGLLRYVHGQSKRVSRWDLSLMVQEYDKLFLLTPHGYLAAALTGAPALCVGPVTVDEMGAGAGGFELGSYYTRSGGNSWPRVDAPNLNRN